MKTPDSNSSNGASSCGDWEEITLIIDVQGDNTVRPIRPERLELVKAEREKLIRWGAMKDQPPPAKS